MDLIGGGVDFQGGYISKILYVKTKELGPLGGACAGCTPLDPPMGMLFKYISINISQLKDLYY